MSRGNGRDHGREHGDRRRHRTRHDWAARSDSGDRGFASIATLAVGAIVVGIASTAVIAGTATVARHEAQAAADFGALAGAVRAQLYPAQACDAARAIVEANQATMQTCSIDGDDVTVTAAVTLAAAPALGPAMATARAGSLDFSATAGVGSV